MEVFWNIPLRLLKTCPWPKGIATREVYRYEMLIKLKTWPWPKGIATSQPNGFSIVSVIKNLSLTQRDCDEHCPRELVVGELKTCPWPKGIATNAVQVVSHVMD